MIRATSGARTKKSSARTKKSGVRTARSSARTKKSGVRTASSVAVPARVGGSTRSTPRSIDGGRLDLTHLVAAQRERLRLGEHDGLATKGQAAVFLAEVALALRYGPNPVLPIASMYQAVARLANGEPEAERDAQRRATQLTNALIADGAIVEITVVADRVGLAHASIVPALFALRRRRRGITDLDLSDTARRVLEYIGDHPRPTAGQIRAHLGVPPKT